ncbi:MAG: hypothetical protein ABIQ18_00560, partial [Umezawaea sp.]
MRRRRRGRRAGRRHGPLRRRLDVHRGPAHQHSGHRCTTHHATSALAAPCRSAWRVPTGATTAATPVPAAPRPPNTLRGNGTGSSTVDRLGVGGPAFAGPDEEDDPLCDPELQGGGQANGGNLTDTLDTLRGAGAQLPDQPLALV